ncbi:MAG TPA: YceI family protein [Candidatus Binataceae bacterium]|nr:YceI family protein [Candidatus Binataceae bacterium]
MGHTAIVYNLMGWPNITHGTFKPKRGMVRVDPESGKMDGKIVADAASGDSGHSLRDDRMKQSILEPGQGIGEPSILFFKVENHVDIEVTALAHLRWVSP